MSSHPYSFSLLLILHMVATRIITYKYIHSSIPQIFTEGLFEHYSRHDILMREKQLRRFRWCHTSVQKIFTTYFQECPFLKIRSQKSLQSRFLSLWFSPAHKLIDTCALNSSLFPYTGQVLDMYHCLCPEPSSHSPLWGAACPPKTRA